ncbi:CASP8-associated protein 2 [Protopterus annectens]|uniref:CASP8-associated protein 2 n=1 Tax=Protopterus annectens TaxID=7888 RepID=UPI001CF97976|nr:CASP8-associated protein 2 [Protopterus annectens]
MEDYLHLLFFIYNRLSGSSNTWSKRNKLYRSECSVNLSSGAKPEARVSNLCSARVHNSGTSLVEDFGKRESGFSKYPQSNFKQRNVIKDRHSSKGSFVDASKTVPSYCTETQRSKENVELHLQSLPIETSEVSDHSVKHRGERRSDGSYSRTPEDRYRKDVSKSNSSHSDLWSGQSDSNKKRHMYSEYRSPYDRGYERTSSASSCPERGQTRQSISGKEKDIFSEDKLKREEFNENKKNERRPEKSQSIDIKDASKKTEEEKSPAGSQYASKMTKKKEIVQSGSIDAHKKTDQEKSPTVDRHSCKERGRERLSFGSKKTEREMSKYFSKDISNKVQREMSPPGIKDVSKKNEWAEAPVRSGDGSKNIEREETLGSMKNVDKKTEREMYDLSSKDANRKKSEHFLINNHNSSKKTEGENILLSCKDACKTISKEEPPSNNKNVNKEKREDSQDVSRKGEREESSVSSNIGKNTEHEKSPVSKKDISKKSERENSLINNKGIDNSCSVFLPTTSKDVSKMKEREESLAGPKDIYKKKEGEELPSCNKVIGKKTITESSPVSSKEANKTKRDVSTAGINDGSKTDTEKSLVSSKDSNKMVESGDSLSIAKYANKKTEVENLAVGIKDANAGTERESSSLSSQGIGKKNEREESADFSKDASKIIMREDVQSVKEASKTIRREETPPDSKDANKKTEREKIAVGKKNVGRKTEREKSPTSTDGVTKKMECEKSVFSSKYFDKKSMTEKSPSSSKDSKRSCKPEKKTVKPRQFPKEKGERLRRSGRLRSPHSMDLSPQKPNLRSPYKSSKIIVRYGSKTQASKAEVKKSKEIADVKRTDGICRVRDPRHDNRSKRDRSEDENKDSSEIKIYRDKMKVVGQKSKDQQLKFSPDPANDKKKSITAQQEGLLLDVNNVNNKECSSKQESEQNNNPKVCFMEKLNLTLSPGRKNVLSSNFDGCTSYIPVKENGKAEYEYKEGLQSSSKSAQKSELQSNEAHNQKTEGQHTGASTVLIEVAHERIQSSLENISLPETMEEICSTLKENTVKHRDSYFAKSDRDLSSAVVPDPKEKSSTYCLEADITSASFQTARDPVQIPESPQRKLVESRESVEVFSVAEYEETQKSALSLEFRCSTPFVDFENKPSTGLSEQTYTVTEPSKIVETVACKLKQMHLSAKGLGSSFASEFVISATKPVEALEVCILEASSVSKDGMKTAEQATAYLHDDEGSVQSIDLNQMRHIPALISPLTSPVRMGSQFHKPDNSSKQAVMNRTDKELYSDKRTSSAEKNTSTEINKENRKPDNEPANISDNGSYIPISTDLEEGEILSEIEDEQVSDTLNKSHCKTSPKRLKARESHRHKRGSETVNSRKCGKKEHDKSRKSHTEAASSSYCFRRKNDLRASVLPSSPKKFVTPSSVHEAMLMLGETRKQVRKKYMKLHKDLKQRQFVRAIEVAVIDFSKMIKTLNWSRLSTDHHLQHLLCSTIETNLEKVKSNGIVRRIFDLQHPNMKTSLWLFVEEQLDYLFEKIKKILQRSYEGVNRNVSRHDKRQLDSAGEYKPDNKSMSKHKKQPSHKDRTPKLSVSQSSFSTSVKRSFSEEKSEKQLKKKSCELMEKMTEVETINQSSGKRLSFDRASSKIKDSTPGPDTHVTTAVEEDGHKVSKTEIKLQNRSAITIGASEEEVSKGLNFTIVNDSQMGEMFKSLLQDSQHLEQSAVEAESNSETSMLCQTQNSGYLSEENISSCVSTPQKVFQKSEEVADSFWCTVTPEKSLNISAEPKTPVQLDVLDESCMLEVPDFMTQGKFPFSSTNKQSSTFPSILLEDLAVSSTVPSPLKSDVHLSFLQTEKEGHVPEVTTQEVITTHYSEGAVLEEGDTNEHDIHLALDSDNSSSKSSSSTCQENQEDSAGFQYHSSLPMQAVVMEKSNDHFIVKIWCAPSLTTPETEDLSQVAEAQSVPSLRNEHQKPLEENSSTGESSEDSAERGVDRNVSCGGKTSEVLVSSPLSEHNGPKVQSEISYQDSCAFASKEDESMATSEALVCTTEDGDHIPQVMHTIEIETETEAEHDKTSRASPCGMEMISSEFSESRAVGPCSSQQANDVVTRKRKRKTACQQHTKKARKEINCTYKRNPSRKSKGSSDSASGKKCRKNLSTPEKKGTSPVMSLSPNSLSAKNVIKKKGGVVVAWTKDDDRQILLECQQKGLSEKTFEVLSTKLSKTPEQIEERFDQLMKLFKRAKKMNA